MLEAYLYRRLLVAQWDMPGYAYLAVEQDNADFGLGGLHLRANEVA